MNQEPLLDGEDDDEGEEQELQEVIIDKQVMQQFASKVPFT